MLESENLIEIYLQLYYTQKKRVPKQYHWGTIATNSTLFLEGHYVYETVPLRSLGHQNSTPKGTILWTVK